MSMSSWGFLLFLLPLLIWKIVDLALRDYANANSDEDSSCRLTGSEVAKKLLQFAGIDCVDIFQVPTILGDQYDRKTQKIGLSPLVYDSTSIVAVAIAAHEVGHATQDLLGSFCFRLRTLSAKIFFFAESGWVFAWLLWLNTQSNLMLYLMLVLYLHRIVFRLITLFLEFDASRRGLQMLGYTGLLTAKEFVPARTMLRCAFYTYVASVVAVIIQLLAVLMVS